MEALGIQAGYLISQIVNLLILLVAMRALLYEPVLGMLDRRAAKIRQGLADAEAASTRAEQAEADYQKRLEEAGIKAQEIIKQANEQAQKLRQQTLQEARQEAQQLLEQTRQEIDLERQQALRAQRTELADLVVDTTAKIIGQTLDESGHRRLIEQFLAEGAAST
jgi:F-type H+-transporting ATPase subunit b